MARSSKRCLAMFSKISKVFSAWNNSLNQNLLLSHRIELLWRQRFFLTTVEQKTRNKREFYHLYWILLALLPETMTNINNAKLNKNNSKKEIDDNTVFYLKFNEFWFTNNAIKMWNSFVYWNKCHIQNVYHFTISMFYEAHKCVGMIPYFISSPVLVDITNTDTHTYSCTLVNANNLIALFNLDNYRIFILKNLFIIDLLQDDSRFKWKTFLGVCIRACVNCVWLGAHAPKHSLVYTHMRFLCLSHTQKVKWNETFVKWKWIRWINELFGWIFTFKLSDAFHEFVDLHTPNKWNEIVAKNKCETERWKVCVNQFVNICFTFDVIITMNWNTTHRIHKFSVQACLHHTYILYNFIWRPLHSFQ